MIYEIEGELEDPKTGEKLPFKATYKIVSRKHIVINPTVKDDKNEPEEQSSNNGSDLPIGS